MTKPTWYVNNSDIALARVMINVYDCNLCKENKTWETGSGSILIYQLRNHMSGFIALTTHRRLVQFTAATLVITLLHSELIFFY